MENYKILKSLLNKINFYSGHRPKVIYSNNDLIRKFIPSHYRSVLILSCDFELAWALRFAKQMNYNPAKIKEITKQERENIDYILELCDKFKIPITWAVVGHLFLKGCKKEEGRAHPDIPRPAYFENKYWRFKKGDWFDNDPCCDWQRAIEWYAPDLIERIVSLGVKQEIACHTFSHIDCREKVCTPEILRAELKKCKNLAFTYGIDLKSFVFPANLVGNLNVLREEGFISYRIDKDVLGFPERDKYGLWQIPTTAEIGLSSYNWSLDYYIKRYKIIIERAIKYRRLCHFWLHPSSNKTFLQKILHSLFQLIDSKKDELYITTMRDYINFLQHEKF